MNNIWIDSSGGLNFNSDGTVIIDSSGHLATCCCQAPGACPSGLSGYYRIVLDPGDLTGCSECVDSLADVWAYDFYGAPESCMWSAPELKSISGKALSYAGAGGTAVDCYIMLDTVNRKWLMGVYCLRNLGDSALPMYDAVALWIGQKLTGLSPAGIFTRLSGCDTTSALVVEAFTP